MKRILFFTFTVLLTISKTAFSQVINETYNIQALFVQGYGRISSETNPTPIFLGKIAEDTDNFPSLVLNTSFNAVNTGNICYGQNLESDTDFWGPIANFSMGYITGSPTPKFDFTVLSYEKDGGGTRCQYQDVNGQEYYRDDNGASIAGLIDSKFNNAKPSSASDIQEFPISNGSKFKMKWAYRNAQGAHRFNALDFGNLDYTYNKYHINSNRGVPDDFTALDIGYYNYFDSNFPGTHSFTDGNDVVYKFSIQSTTQTLTISTDFPETNFDTYIHLINLSEDGQTWSYIVGNDDIYGYANTKSQIIRDLCPGNYAVVVEGYDSGYLGDFKINIAAAEKYPNGGSIEIAGGGDLKQICPNSNFINIENTESASSTLSDIIYSWEKIINQVDIEVIPGMSATNLPASDNIGTASMVTFRRIATLACAPNIYSQSNAVTFYAYTVNATSGGSISGGGTIPYYQEQIVNIAAGTAGVASPGVSYSWEQSLNAGSSWQAAVPAQTSASFTLPKYNNPSYEPLFDNITDIKYRRKTKSTCISEVFANSNVIDYKVVKGNGRIYGGLLAVKDKAGNGVDGITIRVERITTPTGGTPNKKDSAITVNEGQYNIPKLYYGRTDANSTDEATYIVTPFKPLHRFDPASRTVVLNKNNSERNLTFTDTTGFSISGYITQYCATCDGATVAANTDSLKNVKILESPVSGAPVVHQGKTTSDQGKYSTIKPNQGNFIIKPEFENHEFSPNQTTVNLSANLFVEGINFQDTSTNVASGYIKMDCPIPDIGVTQLLFKKILAPGDGITRLKKTVSTNPNHNGYYQARLPAGKYLIEVMNVSIKPGSDLNAAQVKIFLNSYADSLRTIDITTKDSTLNIYYHESPKLEIYGLKKPVCTDANAMFGGSLLSSYSIFEQGVPTPFSIGVFEGNVSKNCRVTDDTVTLATNFSGSSEFIKIPFVAGAVDTTLTAKNVNVAPPFVQTLSVVYTDRWGQAAPNLVLKPVVLGAEASNSSFFTVSPQIPLLILRDPPGDQSYSYFAENTTVETVSSFYSASSLELGTWVEAKLGAKFEAGIGFSTESEFYGSVGGSLSLGAGLGSSSERINRFTTSNVFKTNSAGIPGEQGDVFMGAAINLKYAKVIEVLYDSDSCKFKTKKSFAMADSGYATTFVYSKDHIQNFLIPTIRQAASLAISQGKKDSLNNQAYIWEQTLQRNEELKKKAKFIKNYSFDGTGEIDESTTGTVSSSSAIEFTMEINANLALELGMEVGGSGLKGGSNVAFRMETGGADIKTDIVETVTGYVLKDDDGGGDFFSVNVKNDPTYGTPVFELVAGTSSCPHEEGTQYRDKFNFYVPDAIKTNIAPTDEALFQLFLSNISDSEEQRPYYVQFVQGSADAADVRIGTNGSGTPVLINQPYNQINFFNAYVKRALGTNEFSYDDVRFRAFDGCSNGNAAQMDVFKEVTVQAFFNNPCSPIALSIPEEGFHQNTNTLTAEFKDYTYSAAFDDIAIQYAFQGSNTWTTKETYTKAAYMNNAFGFIKSVNIADLPDGKYKFRAKLKCGLNNIYSKSVNGIIDRKAPALFGSLEPSDRQYVAGDVISATFNEAINCNVMQQTDFTLKRASNNAPVAATLGCYQNQILITPSIDLAATLNGEKLLVTLSGVEDLSGNVSGQTFAWDFTIGTAPVSNSPHTVNFLAGLNQIAENANDSIAVTITISPAKLYKNVVYFTIGGSATSEADYRLVGQNPTTTFEGSVAFDSLQTSKTVYIRPINDAQVETDESVILSLLPSPDYKVGTNKTRTVLILNDDVLASDCDNNGNPYLLTNNNVGGTALTGGTYHKLLLESNGKIDAPTTIIFKGEKSVTLKPGFVVQSGSVFLAQTENCPENLSAGLVSPSFISEKTNQVAANDGFTSQSIFSEYQITELSKSGEIKLDFNGKSEFGILAELNTSGGQMLDSNWIISTTNNPKDQLILNANDLKSGEYILKMKREGRTLFHRFIVK